MTIEFVLMKNQETFPRSQELPNMFRELCYNGNRHVYVTSNTRYRFKCLLVVPNGRNIRITGGRWSQFCQENLLTARMIHFIQQGDDTFYVTAYDDNGLECGGYNIVRKRPSRILTRVWPYHDYDQMMPIDFLQGINENAPLVVRVNFEEYNLRFERVEIGDNTGVFKYQIVEDSWNALVAGLGLESGMFVVLTKLRMNRGSLMAFDMEGSAVTINDFTGITCLKKRQRDLSHDELDDDRMHHVCLWPCHLEHFGETTNTFYRPFSSTLDKNRLAIKADFLKNNPMHTYRKVVVKYQELEWEMRIQMDHHKEKPSRTNHVNIYGDWRELGDICRFDATKMLRMKYVGNIHVLDGDDEDEEIPMFHVC